MGRALPNASVTVLTLTGEKAELFADNFGTPLANPVTTNKQGEFEFYAANGRYSLQILAAGYPGESDLDVVMMLDPDDFVDAVVDPKIGRTIRLPADEDQIAALPGVAERAGKALIFDEQGHPTVSDDDYNDQVAAVGQIRDDAVAARNAAQDAQGAAEDARDDARAIADQFGDVQGAIDAATEQADRAEQEADRAHQQATRAEQEADRAEAARDAAMQYAGMYPDVETALDGAPPEWPAVDDGHFFSVPDGSGGVIIYQRDGVDAIEQGQFATRAALDAVLRAAEDLPQKLAEGGMVIYKGDGPVIPFQIDGVDRVLLGYDITQDKIIGAGLIHADDVSGLAREQMGEMSVAAYKGSGPVIPMLTDKANRVLFGYDVSADRIIGAGVADGAGVLSDAPDPLPNALKPVSKAVNGILGYGQSNSVGAGGRPLISTTQPYSNVTFKGGPRANSADFSEFKPLVEDEISPAPDGGSARGETFCSGAANYAVSLAARLGADPSERVIFASTAGRGSTAIASLKKGTSWYNNHLIAHIEGLVALEPDSAIHLVPWLHGESNARAETDYATYRAELAALQADIEDDVQSRTGQTSPVFFGVVQFSSYITDWSDVHLAMLDLCEKNDRFVFVTPTYHLPFRPEETTQHLTNVGHKWIGAYIGRVYHYLVELGVKPPYLKPVSATRRGDVIRLRFKVPTRPLRIDLVNLAPTEDCGLRVEDENGKVDIESVSVDGDDVVIVTATIPTGATTVRCAMDYLGDGLGIYAGASSNIRDSSPDTITISGVEYPLWHVAPHFTMPVIALGE